MLRALIQEYKNGNTVIDIIGFSRGAALAREFANMINEGSFFTGNYQHEWNRYGRLFTRRVFQKCPEVRFLGIFDTVASFGMPGNDVDVVRDRTIWNIQPGEIARKISERELDEIEKAVRKAIQNFLYIY